MFKKSELNRFISILEKSAKRSLEIKKPGFPSPFYTSFLLRDTEFFSIWSKDGSIFRNRFDPSRYAYCDLRVGSYKFDQTTDGGLKDNDDESESYSYITMPCDDNSSKALSLSLWKLTETKYREALTAYNQKESKQITSIDPNTRLSSFKKFPPLKSIDFGNFKDIDQEKWISFSKKLSSWISKLPNLFNHWVDLSIFYENKIFVSTENRIIVQNSAIYTLYANLRSHAKDGNFIDQHYVVNCGEESELPTIEVAKKEILKKYSQLKDLVQARRINSFSGPVLLYPKPSGLLFHEAIGHRLEGSRHLSQGEGQTFKGQEGKRVLNVKLDIKDNPLIEKFNNQSCIGSFKYDDEGTDAKDAILIKDGILKDFLSTRAMTKEKNFIPNGHARNRRFQRPISRMGVTMIIPDEDTVYTIKELKELLLKEIREQKKSYGLIVYETIGGETDTSAYDFQAFAGEISYATLVDKDGNEETIRGVNFVGTPLQALNHVIASGNELVLDNSFCGAESGFIPVTTISPAVLIKSLELQSKEEDLIAPFLLQPPSF